MKYVVYKTTNSINNKIYIGVHQVDKNHEYYMGSGELLHKAIKKYGIENFKKKILKKFVKKSDAYQFEKELVNEQFIKSQRTYNIRIGGDGGNGGKECNKKISEKLKGRVPKSCYNEKSKKKRVNTMYKRYGERAFELFSRKKHSPETIQKMKNSAKGKHKGVLNSQYNTCWIYSLEKKKNKKIKTSQLIFWLNRGWIKGRKMKF